MFDFLKKWMKPKTCAICHQRPDRPTTYFNDLGEEVKVCFKCVPYAERRAFRKKI